MNFKEALDKICNQFNKEIIFERRVISILDDYGAFKDVPYYKLFYKTILSSSDVKKLVGNNENDRNKELFTFISLTGLDENKVKSFLAIILGCHNGIKTSPHRDRNSTSSSNTKYSDKREVQQPEIDYSKITQSNQIRFMEVPIGARYLEFENALFKRGASLYRNNMQEVTFLLKDYLFERDAHITLYHSKNSKIVYKISIEILTGLTVDEYRKNFTTKVLNLYQRKYGNNYATYPSNETIYEWDMRDAEISICDAVKKTVIVYRLMTEDIRKYEEAIKLDKLRKFHEAERIKKEQEELKRKREEEAKRLKAKRMFDDI